MRGKTNLGIRVLMGESRIDRALARIDVALARLDQARGSMLAATDAQASAHGEKDSGSSAKVMELVNRHEKLREEVTDTLRDLDTLIDELEG